MYFIESKQFSIANQEEAWGLLAVSGKAAESESESELEWSESTVPPGVGVGVRVTKILPTPTPESESFTILGFATQSLGTHNRSLQAR